jgi:peroxisomal membrane protein 2
MVPNPASLTCKSPLLYRFMGFSHRPISHFGHQTRIPANPVQISGFRSCSSRQSFSYPLNSGLGAVFKNLGRSEMRFRHLGFDNFRVSAVSDGGSGGSGGYGGSGGRGEGGSSSGGAGSSDGGGGSNWSFLSW